MAKRHEASLDTVAVASSADAALLAEQLYELRKTLEVAANEKGIKAVLDAMPPSREVSLARTRFEEGFFWLNRAADALVAEIDF